MISNPIVIFELSSGSPDPFLLTVARTDLATLTADQASEMYMRVVRSAVETGSAFAMCLCATWPDKMRRERLTDEERYSWAERAAQCNYPPGLFDWGMCFEKGTGVPVDMTKAHALYERSAAGGFGFAAHRLGMGYMEGHFGAVDASKAIHFMELACEQGEPLGALFLAQWFESGEGVTKNWPTSVRWYERASALGNFFATHRLHLAYMTGNLGLPRDAISAKRYEDILFQQTTETETPNRRAPPE